MHDEPAAAYLADLLTRFARTDDLFPRGVTVPRLETRGRHAARGAGGVGRRRGGLRPEREVTVRRHIGDYTLFMTGVFPERVARWPRRATTSSRASAPTASSPSTTAPAARDGPLYRRLAERFERYTARAGLRAARTLRRRPGRAPSSASSWPSPERCRATPDADALAALSTPPSPTPRGSIRRRWPGWPPGPRRRRRHAARVRRRARRRRPAGAGARSPSERAERTVRRAARRALYRLAQRGMRRRRVRRPSRSWSGGPSGRRGRGCRAWTAAARARCGSCSTAASAAPRCARSSSTTRPASSRSPAATSPRSAWRPSWRRCAPRRSCRGWRSIRRARVASSARPSRCTARGHRAAGGVRALAAAVRVGPTRAPPALAADPALGASAPPRCSSCRSWRAGSSIPRPCRATRSTLLQARESRLVSSRSDQGRARGGHRRRAWSSASCRPSARRRWARRLVEMALIFARDRPADRPRWPGRPPPRSPTTPARRAAIRSCCALARRGLDVAARGRARPRQRRRRQPQACRQRP